MPTEMEEGAYAARAGVALKGGDTNNNNKNFVKNKKSRGARMTPRPSRRALQPNGKTPQ
jgi:hypothetical protein